MSHVSELLAERAFGALDAVSKASLEAHLDACPDCAAEARSWDEAALALADALPTGSAPRTIRARVLAAAAGAGRLARHAATLADIFEVPNEKALALLDEIDAPGAWEPGPVPGLALLHLKGGPALAAADTGFVRFPAGLAWPLHRHLGEETMLIVEGAITDDRGATHRAGDVVRMAGGTEHSFDIIAGRDCIAAVVVHEGIELPPGHRLKL